MKLFGAAMLRNEADVVESFVRHNLALLDGLSVVDHGSSDGTSEILNALVAEGLPLEVERDASVGYLQSEIMTRTVRNAFMRHGADFVFALDGDEFLRIARRDLLDGVLATLPHACTPRCNGRPTFRNSTMVRRLRGTYSHGRSGGSPRSDTACTRSSSPERLPTRPMPSSPSAIMWSCRARDTPSPNSRSSMRGSRPKLSRWLIFPCAARASSPTRSSSAGWRIARRGGATPISHFTGGSCTGSWRTDRRPVSSGCARSPPITDCR